MRQIDRVGALIHDMPFKVSNGTAPQQALVVYIQIAIPEGVVALTIRRRPAAPTGAASVVPCKIWKVWSI